MQIQPARISWLISNRVPRPCSTLSSGTGVEASGIWQYLSNVSNVAANMIFKQGKNAPLVTPVAWIIQNASRLEQTIFTCRPLPCWGWLEKRGSWWRKGEKERESRLTAQLHRGHKGVAFLLQYTESREGWIDGYNRSIDRYRLTDWLIDLIGRWTDRKIDK